MDTHLDSYFQSMDWARVVVELQVVYIHFALVTSGANLKHCKQDGRILLNIEFAVKSADSDEVCSYVLRLSMFFYLPQHSQQQESSRKNKQNRKPKQHNTRQRRASRSPLSQRLYPRILGRTPPGSSTIWAKREQFIRRAKRAIPIILRANLIAYLLALKDGVTMRAAQEQILPPIPGVAFWTHIGRPASAQRRHRPLMMTTTTVTRIIVPGCQGSLSHPLRLGSNTA
jgi:hypothetical protein